jgi:cytochrome oxidase Cu insertion factor (SCO1/SenC/PrrC family)
MKRSLLAAVAVVCLAEQALPAQQPPPSSRTIDVSKLGTQVGQTIPDFRLKDQSGREWTRQSILGPKGAMIVFYRSADW